jgi:Na+/alanine symporter
MAGCVVLGGIYEGKTKNFRKGPIYELSEKFSWSCCSDFYSPVHWVVAFAPSGQTA